MRILIFHGYLLGGTGSNVYNARLAAALVGLGHEVHLLSQDRHPDRQPFVDAVADWDRGQLRVQTLREPVRCTVYRPNIGGLLPVYVADRYEGVEARTFPDCSEAELRFYLDSNVAAVRELAGLAQPEVALANHLVMGPAILARGLSCSVPYAVKVHGSALEYTVKPHPERFLPFAREGLASATIVLVGSRHTALSLWAAMGDAKLPGRTRLGPPGVDVERFRARDQRSAARAVRELADRLTGHGAAPRRSVVGTAEDAFARDEHAAGQALGQLRPGPDRLVCFVGKLIVSKGVDLLLAAWPLVLERVPRARLVVVGFGAYRDGLEQLRAALLAGDVDRARAVAAAGRALEAPATPARPLRHLLAFLDSLGPAELERYLRAAGRLDERVVLTGRLDHEELGELLPACEALVVPSTFPEAFGMVAVEAAACGAFPVSAAHSGLAEVSDVLAGAVPKRAARWLSFPVDDGAVGALARCLVGWLEADAALRATTRSRLASVARERWSWAGVARGVIAAARGEADRLVEP